MSTVRTSSYNDNEDIHLCHCYLDVSRNPIKGRNQSKNKFWARIETQYHATEPFATNPRPRRSLETRMFGILKATKKLRGCINQVRSKNPSGVSEQDIMNEAKAMLKLDVAYKKGFKFDHVWHLMKDWENSSNVTATRQHQRQSPYQSSSPGPGPSSGADVSLPSLNLNEEVNITLTQTPIGVEKEKSKLCYDNKQESLVKAIIKMSKAINKNSEAIIKRTEVQVERNAINTRLADDKIMFTDLNSITDPVFLEFIKNEKIRIMRKRTGEHMDDAYGQRSEHQGSQYRASQHQGSGEEGSSR